MRYKNPRAILFAVFTTAAISACSPRNDPALVFQSDFGLKDGAVSAMKGVATGVDRSLRIYDVTHDITPYAIWEASYRLYQVAEYWPPGTVFVSVVDPGVGSDRKSVIMKTRSGHYFVSPDNGTLTMVAMHLGVEEMREIDERINRREGSSGSYTFHGRDVYAYAGARLASGQIAFEDIGRELPPTPVMLEYTQPELKNELIEGSLVILDPQYGNVWTNIPDTLIHSAGFSKDDSLRVKIFKDTIVVFEGEIPLKNTFDDVERGRPLAYFNSLMKLAFAINQGNFAETYSVETGPLWRAEISKSGTIISK